MPNQTALPFDRVDAILARYGCKRTSVIPIMQDIQKEYRYLPPVFLSYIAEKLDMSEAKVYSIATFYENFSLEPKGKFVVKICDGTACHVKRSLPILEALRKKLGLSEEKPTTDDALFTVETVSCLGACGLAPVIMVNETVHSRVTPEYACELVDKLSSEQA